MSEDKKTIELEDEEIEKVTGGRTYSKSTYSSFGFKKKYHGQSLDNHPLIVTIFNHCKLSEKCCINCTHCFSLRGNPAFYCALRSKEYDPCK